MRRLLKLTPTFGRFLLVGLSGTLVNLFVLWLLVNFGVIETIAAVLATETAIINNFFWNDRWAFKKAATYSKSSILERFVRFQLVTSLTAALTLGLFTLFNHFLGWNYLLAQLAAIGIATLINFGMNSKITWHLPLPPAGLNQPFSLNNSREVK